MSFILDALKKSEAERQRQHAPGIASIAESGRQQRGSRWGLVIGGLLALNLAVLGGLMLRPAEPTATDEPAPRAAVPVSPPAADPQPASVPAPAVTRLPEPGGGAVAASAETAAAQVPVPQAPPAAATALPSLAELRTQGLVNLPEMHLDIHVYGAQPADRFVFVNMTKYLEGGRLAEGPAVREITPDGVVLDYQGMRFLLPRE